MKKRRFSNLPLTTKFTIVILIFMVIPIGILTAVIFRNMEENIMEENRDYMRYKLEMTRSSLQTVTDSVHMSTRFFAADDGLLRVLDRAETGRSMSTRQLIQFNDEDAADLGRMVANNPTMYSVRVYGVNDSITEMRSIVYKHSRLKNMSWGDSADITGWHLGYEDTTFGSLTVDDGTTLAGLVSPVNGKNGTLMGYIESSVKMDTAFPMLYSDEGTGDWAYILDSNGKAVHGSNWPDRADDLAAALKKKKSLMSSEKIISYSSDGRTYMVLSMPIDEMDATYIGMRDITSQISVVHNLRLAFIIVLIGIMILVWLMVDRIVVSQMLGKLYMVLEKEREIRHNRDFSLRIEEHPDESDEIEELVHQTNEMLDSLEKSNRQNVEREIIIRNTSIKALQNQINAHFIYNVLESIKMLAEIDEEYVISDSITSLGKLMRYSIRWTNGNVSMSEEIEYINDYVSLMNLRNDFTVTLAENIPEELMHQEIPKMSLQPVIENSIKHGIAPIGEDAAIYIKVSRNGDRVIAEISDNGAGMDAQTLERLRRKLTEDADPEAGKGHGVGLKNVEDRIHLSFGDEYGLEIWSEKGRYTKVAITLPYRIRKEEQS